MMLHVFYAFICISLLAGNVQAEDKINSTPPVINNGQASKEIELLRATVKSTMAERGFMGLFSSKTNPVNNDLLAEIDSFIYRFSDLEDAAEIYHLKAQVEKRYDRNHDAALNWLMLLAAYPSSTFATEANKGLKELLDEKLGTQANIIKAMTNKISSLSGDRDQRVASFLSFLGTLHENEFAAPIATECAAFLMRKQAYVDNDRIEYALAQQQTLLNKDVAIYHFNKLLTLYPNSSLRPSSILSIGIIQRQAMNQYEKAASSFKAVIEKYPDSDETKQSYELLANMYDEDMRDYISAIKSYEAIVTRYKDEPVVLRALHALERIYQDKINQPMRAIEIYRKEAETFKGKDGLEALIKAEKLAIGTIRDWDMSIDLNEHIIAAYPDNDEAVIALYDNAKIQEDNLKDREQAIKLYLEVIKRYPNHNLANEAKRRISSLEKDKK